jgi:hypothetical protein
METTNSNHIVIAYGFEYDKVIIKDNNCCIGKSIISKNPVYCSLMIKDNNFATIINKMSIMKLNYNDYLHHINKLAKSQGVTPKWQLVMYDKDYEYYIHVLQGKILNYNSNLLPEY